MRIQRLSVFVDGAKVGRCKFFNKVIWSRATGRESNEHVSLSESTMGGIYPVRSRGACYVSGHTDNRSILAPCTYYTLIDYLAVV